MSPRATRIYALAVIFFANFLSYMDRQLVSALEKQLQGAFPMGKAEFEIWFGLLYTFFTIGYMVCAPPIGFLADKFHRPRIFAACVFVWSLATVASGMATVPWVLSISRIFIGVGEAGCLVIGPAIISDLFSREARGKALSVFFLGLPLGGTFAFILSGLMEGASWRTMFYVAGLPGFLIALLIGLMRDPARGASEGAVDTGHKGGGFREYLELLKTKTLMLIILGQMFAVITLAPLIHFGKRFFIDGRNMSEKSASISVGLIVLIAGALGNSLSGFIGDRLQKKRAGGYALMAGVSFILGWPFMLVGFLVKEPWIFLPAIGMGCFFYFLCMPAVNTQIANVTSPARRSAAWALAVFVLHLFGDMPAPPVFGAISGHIGRQTSFTLFSCSLILAGICCLFAARTARQDEARQTGKLAS